MEPTRQLAESDHASWRDQRLTLVSTMCALTLAAFAVTRLVRWLWLTVGLSDQDVFSRASWMAAAETLFGDGFIALVLLLALGAAARHLATGGTLSDTERLALAGAAVWGALGMVANIGASGIVVHSWQTEAMAAGAYEISPGWATAGFVATAALSALLVWGALGLLRRGLTPMEWAPEAED